MQAAAQEMSLRAVLDEDLSNYTLCDDGRYEVYTEYTDDAVSEVDKHKNITVNEEQCNLTQEENSQYVPFKLPRYWDGVDLMTKLIQFHYVNINGGSGISTAVNVRFNDSYIICGWLINKSVTAVAGDVTFEITATGTNEKSADYRWRTRPNGKFTVLEALSYDGIIEPSDDWYAGFVKSMQEYTTKAAESARSAQDYADQSKSNLDQVTQITETFTTNAQEVKETAINEINNAKVSGVNAVEAAATEIVNDREKITENANNISSLKGDLVYVSKFEYQYLDKAVEENKKFYIGFGQSQDTEYKAYYIYPIVSLPAGKFYLHRISDVFTFFDDGIKLADFNGYDSSNQVLTLDAPKKIAATSYRGENDYGAISTIEIDSYKYGVLSVKIVADDISKRVENLEANHVIITVGQDKNFSSIKNAVESIKDSSKTKNYDVLIDDGVYNEYAITLPDYVNLIGVSGNREKCVIKGELPDDATTQEIESNSTINLLYNNKLENLTITARNLRYPIHSESGGNATDWVQVLSNCYVEHFGNTSPNSTWTSYHAWGEGASSGAYAEFNNCVFKGDLGAWYVHEPTNMPSVNPKPYHHVLNNCEIINNRISTTPYWNGAVAIDNTTDKGVISTIEFNNCNFGNGSVGVAGKYDINVGIHGCNNVPVTRSDASQHNYPNTDYTTIKTYVGTEKISKNTVLMYADGINLVKKATSSTSAEMIAGVATEDCEPNNFVKIIKGTYVSKTGNVGQKVYCDDNGQLADAGTIVIGTCYGQFSLIN